MKATRFVPIVLAESIIGEQLLLRRDVADRNNCTSRHASGSNGSSGCDGGTILTLARPALASFMYATGHWPLRISSEAPDFVEAGSATQQNTPAEDRLATCSPSACLNGFRPFLYDTQSSVDARSPHPVPMTSPFLRDFTVRRPRPDSLPATLDPAATSSTLIAAQFFLRVSSNKRGSRYD